MIPVAFELIGKFQSRRGNRLINDRIRGPAGLCALRLRFMKQFPVFTTRQTQSGIESETGFFEKGDPSQPASGCNLDAVIEPLFT